MVDRDELVAVQLNGSALFHTDEKTPPAEAIADVRAKATVDGRLRTDLLEQAAASLLGQYLSNPRLWARQRTAALLLWHAGADKDRVKELAEPIRARLAAPHEPGIGNPRPSR